jgi:hypothetical protein
MEDMGAPTSPVHWRVYVLGDVHGHRAQLEAHLAAAGLLAAGRWAGGGAQLWLLGDLFDRGPDGLGALELVMRMQHEAAAAGGRVEMLFGNHELALLTAHRFPDFVTRTGRTFREDWARWGGAATDLDGLRANHVAWLLQRPAMAHVAGRLLVHADSLLYLRFGRSVDEVNRRWRALLADGDAEVYDGLLDGFGDRKAFWGEAGRQRAAEMLATYGGRQVVHGHTPIPYQTGEPAESVRGPHRYAGALCLNVDGGMYLGGPGFLCELAEVDGLTPPAPRAC